MPAFSLTMLLAALVRFIVPQNGPVGLSIPSSMANCEHDKVRHLPSEGRGHKFESCRARHFGTKLGTPKLADCPVFCTHNDLGCLPVAKRSTGGQRLFRPLSHLEQRIRRPPCRRPQWPVKTRGRRIPGTPRLGQLYAKTIGLHWCPPPRWQDSPGRRPWAGAGRLPKPDCRRAVNCSPAATSNEYRHVVACCLLRLHPSLPPVVRRASAERHRVDSRDQTRRLPVDGAARRRWRPTAHAQWP
jgi:hypothetical protein